MGDPIVERTIILKESIDNEDIHTLIDLVDTVPQIPRINRIVKADVGEVRGLINNAVQSIVKFYGFGKFDQSAIDSLSTVVEAKLTVLSRQLSIVEKRRKDGQPIAYTSPLLQILNIHGIPSYSSLGDFYEEKVKGEYNRVKEKVKKLINGEEKFENQGDEEENNNEKEKTRSSATVSRGRGRGIGGVTRGKKTTMTKIEKTIPCTTKKRGRSKKVLISDNDTVA